MSRTPTLTTLRGAYYGHCSEDSLRVVRPGGVRPPEARPNARASFLGFRTFRQVREHRESNDHH